MKAIVLTQYGDVDKLELRELPDPKPGAGEIKVKVAAASINPADWKIRSGALRIPGMEPPAVLGRDVSGTVIEAGTGVKDFRAGDKVLGLVNHGYAEQVVAKAEGFARVP